MAAKYYQENRKCCKEKPVRTIKIFLKNEKTKNVSMPIISTERFLQKMSLVKKIKIENVNMRAIHVIIFLKKERKKA